MVDERFISNYEAEQQFEQKVRSFLDRDSVVMDLGCAEGGFTLKLADCAKQIVGVDVSKRLLDVAKAKQAELNITNVEFIHSDGQDLLFPADSIDVMVSRLGPLGFSDFLNEAKRVVKPNGWLVELAYGEEDFTNRIENRLAAHGFDLIEIEQIPTKSLHVIWVAKNR